MHSSSIFKPPSGKLPNLQALASLESLAWGKHEQSVVLIEKGLIKVVKVRHDIWQIANHQSEAHVVNLALYIGWVYFSDSSHCVDIFWSGNVFPDNSCTIPPQQTQ
jgi:hypothetical protein